MFFKKPSEFQRGMKREMFGSGSSIGPDDKTGLLISSHATVPARMIDVKKIMFSRRRF